MALRVHLNPQVNAILSSLVACIASGALLGCGSVVASECAVPGKTTAQLQIAVAPEYAAGELVIRGDCRAFTCIAQANGGCVLWEGEISTEGAAACQLTLYVADKAVESARVTGSDACGTATTKKLTLGDG